jgi:hypothetical protein
MKRMIINVTLILVILAGTSVLTMAKAPEKVKLGKQAVENYILNLKSENAGVRKSAIFYTGIYQVKEAEETLNNIYKTSEDVHEKVLVKFAIYLINRGNIDFKLGEIPLEQREQLFGEFTEQFYKELAAQSQDIRRQ